MNTKILCYALLLAVGTVTAQVSHSTVEDRVHTLFKHFADLKNKGISWKCFAQEMSMVLNKKKQYHRLAETFETISSSTDPLVIADALSPHENEIPQGARGVYDNLSYKQLYNILAARIELNDKIKCKIKHDEL